MRLAVLVRPLVNIIAQSSRPRLFQNPTASSPLAVKRSQFATPVTVMSQSQASLSATNSASTATIITPEALSKLLTEKIGATHTSIVDISGGCGQSFQAVIVSPQFEKKNTLARHRLVNAALKEQIAAIHAWSPRCYSPEEWDRAQAAQNPASATTG